MNEADAECLLACQLTRSGGIVARQVRLGLKCADVVVMWSNQSSAQSIEAIEVKLEDWRRGAHQAYLSGSYAHAASLALPRARLARVDQSYLSSLGVGLIGFDEEGWTRVLEPRKRPLDEGVTEAVEMTMAALR